MAINSTAFTKTPQAGDDSFVFGEDQIVANIITLDVMSNDLGGNAKQLWSLDDGVDANGNPVPASALYDALKTSDVGKTWETTARGNLVRIVDGKCSLMSAIPWRRSEATHKALVREKALMIASP